MISIAPFIREMQLKLTLAVTYYTANSTEMCNAMDHNSTYYSMSEHALCNMG